MTLQNITDIPKRVDQLQRQWAGRKKKSEHWYNLIRLVNNLAQDGMESVIGNDPRTSFNMASWLLTPKTWSFAADTSGLSEVEVQSVSALESMVTRQVSQSIRRGRNNLYGSALNYAIRMFLVTGWIALASTPGREWNIQAWNPITVYPHYDGNGNMVELGRKYQLSREQFVIKALSEGWIIPTQLGEKVWVRSLWVQTFFGAFFAVYADQQVVRPMGETGFVHIPVYCNPAGGLPDDGSLVDEKWREEVGQSIVESAMDLQHNYNKMLTYIQQLLRDSANPKWIERVDGGSGYLTPENVTKRGQVYSIGLQEEIFSVGAQPIPVDLRTHQFDLRNQISRAQFSDSSFGEGGDIGVFAMSQATASTKQILEPFQTGLTIGMGELATKNTHEHIRRSQPIGTQELPLNLPSDVSLDYNYDIEIPGDFLQRANAAKIINPEFKLSEETLIRSMFPEVRDPFEEKARVDSEDSMRSEMAMAIKEISEFRRLADQAHLLNNGEAERLLIQAADAREAQILGSPSPQDQTFDQMVQRLG